MRLLRGRSPLLDRNPLPDRSPSSGRIVKAATYSAIASNLYSEMSRCSANSVLNPCNVPSQLVSVTASQPRSVNRSGRVLVG